MFGPAPNFRRWRFFNAERFAVRRPATSDGGAAEPGARLSAAMLRSVSDGVHGAVLSDSSKDMSGLRRLQGLERTATQG